MTLFIANRSAMHFWSMVTTSLDQASRPCTIKSLAKSSSCLRGQGNHLPTELDAIPRPLHLLVDADRKCHRSAGIRIHRLHMAPLKGSFRTITPHIAITSPELSFLEMASELSFVNLIKYGFLLCGTYTANPAAERLNGHAPLTSTAKLQDFLRQAKGHRGLTKALSALRYIQDGSASPQETAVAMLLCLPTKLGGYGFPMPLLNHKVMFAKNEKALFGVAGSTLDLYWPETQTALEYDGLEYHSDAGDVARDRRKNGELNYKGIKVLRVDNEQLSSPSAVYVLAKKLARVTGRRLKTPTATQWQNRIRLHGKLRPKARGALRQEDTASIREEPHPQTNTPARYASHSKVTASTCSTLHSKGASRPTVR